MASNKTGNRFPVWKKVQLGLSTSHYAYLESLKGAGFVVSDPGETALGYLKLLHGVPALNLVKISLKDLGNEPGATCEQVSRSFEKNRLELCPLEVGPALRQQYADQRFGEILNVPMSAIPGFWADLRLWQIGHDKEGKWLDARGVMNDKLNAWAHKRDWVLWQR